VPSRERAGLQLRAAAKLKGSSRLSALWAVCSCSEECYPIDVVGTAALFATSPFAPSPFPVAAQVFQQIAESKDRRNLAHRFSKAGAGNGAELY
jgi:hypothetical protein